MGAQCPWIMSSKPLLPKPPKGGDDKPAAKSMLSARKQLKIGDGNFLKTLKAVLKDGMGRREYFDLAALTGSLLARSLMSLWVAKNMGETIEFFCNKNWNAVFRNIFKFGLVTTMAAVLNAALKLYTGLLATHVRDKLTGKAHKLLMERMNYYKANWVGRDKFENCDQLIADDIEKFSSALADVYSQSLKPVIDLVMFSVQLGSTLGIAGPLGMHAWFACAACFSTIVMPPFGKLAAKEQELEGRFRASHAALIKNSEMVAFMRGEEPEKKQLDGRYASIASHVEDTLARKFTADALQGYVNKYFASVVGFLLTLRPVLQNHHGMAEWSAAAIAAYYVQTRQVMESLATAVLALFELQRRLGGLMGITFRVGMLLDGLKKREPVLEDEKKACIAAGNPPAFKESDVIQFDKVSIYKPDGVLLVNNLTFTIEAPLRVMVTGDNGCGKSSMFRVLCGLWPLCGGTIYKPDDSKIYFLSQVNFVPIGSLREVMIYPKTVDEWRRDGGTDEHLQQVLEWSHLAGFKCDNVHPSLDTTLEWDTALSPGQKQRMAFARLFFHAPRFAVLDECTNGIAPAVEKDLFDRCHKLGMGVFSISHKEGLKAVHDFELHFNADTEGTYEWIDLNEQRRQAEAEAPVSPSSLNFSREVSGLTSQDTLTFSRNSSAEHNECNDLGDSMVMVKTPDMTAEDDPAQGSSTHVDLTNLKDSGSGDLSAEEFAALRAKTKSAAEVAKNMTPEQQAAYGCKTGVAASAVRADSDDSDDEGADFQMGAEGQGALLADY